MAAIFCEKSFFWKLAWLLCRHTLWLKNFASKSLYLARFLRYKHFYMFCNFAKNSKIQNGRHFLREKNFFFENWHGYSAEIPCGSKISSKSLYLARFSRYISIFMFCNFCEKFENSKWRPFFARKAFFENWHGYSAEIPCGSKISSKSLYLARFLRYKHFYMFCNFAKNSKIQNGRHFLRENLFFWKLARGSKISSKSLYLARFSRYISIFMFCNFCEKFENSKWRPFFARKAFFENLHGYSADIPCGSKILRRNRSI